METRDSEVKNQITNSTEDGQYNDESSIKDSVSIYENKSQIIQVGTNQLTISTCKIKQEATKLQTISSQIQIAKQALHDLEQSTPFQCKDTCQDKDAVNKTYKSFHENMTLVQQNFFSKQKLLFEIKMFCQYVFNYFKAINTSLFIQIDSDLPIGDDFLERYSNQKKLIETKFTEISQQQQLQSKQTNTIADRKKIESYTNVIQNLGTSTADLIELQRLQTELASKSERILSLTKEIEKENEELDVLKGKHEYCQNQSKDLQNQQNQEEKNLKELKNQLNEKASKSENGNQALVEFYNEQIKNLSQQAIEIQQKESQNKSNLMEHMSNQFENQMKQLEQMKVGNGKTGRIFILDESGSMSGAVFKNCCEGIRDSLDHFNQNSPNDDFCLIQFDSKARPIITKQQVNQVNKHVIGQQFNGGGTNFNEAFVMLEQMLPLFDDSDMVVVVFFTDGQHCGGDYKQTLRNIKSKIHKTLIFFTIGYGSDIKGESLRSIVEIINGNPMFMQLANGDRIQTYFEVNGASDILKVFQQITNSNTFSVDQFKKKQEISQQTQSELIDNFDFVSKNSIESLNERILDLKNKKKEALENKECLDLTKDILENDISYQKIQKTHYSELHKQVEQQQDEINNKQKEIMGKISQKNIMIKELKAEINGITIQIDSKSNISSHLKEGNQLMVELGFKSNEQYKQFNQSKYSIENFESQITELQNKLTLIVNSINDIHCQLQASIYQIIDIQKSVQTSNYHLIIFDQLRKYLINTCEKDFDSLDHYGVIQQFAYSCDSSLLFELEAEGNEDLLKLSQDLFRIISIEQLVKLHQNSKNEEDPCLLRNYISELQSKFIPEPEIEIDEDLNEQKKELDSELKEKEKELKDATDLTVQEKKSLNEEIKKLKAEIQKVNNDIKKDKQAKTKEVMKEYKKENAQKLKFIEAILSKMYESIQNVKFRIKQNKIAMPMTEIKKQLQKYDDIMPILDTLSIF